MGGAPALADETTDPVANATGLTDGQPLGRVFFKPVFGDDVIAIQTLVNGENATRASAANARKIGAWPNFGTVANDTDVDVTVQFYTAPDVHTDLTTRVHTDFILPTATFSPIGGLVHDTTTITATGLSDDVALVSLARPGEEISRATAAPWELTWDTTGFPVNSSVDLRVTDKAGNTKITSAFYTVDNQGPAVDDRPTLTSGGPGLLSAWIHDPSGVDRVEWWVNGALAGDTADVKYDFGKTSRTLDVVVKAWDKNGHGSESPFKLTVDADAPVIASQTPANGALVRGTSVTSTIRLRDVAGVQFATPVSGYTVTDFTSPYVGKFKLGKDGKLSLKWWVQDNLNQGGYVYQTVLVDNTKPALKVTSGPKNGAKVKGTVKVGATATDRNGVAKVQLLINGKLIATDYRAGYAFSINTAKYGKKFKVQLRAYDKAGNAVVTSTRTWHR